MIARIGAVALISLIAAGLMSGCQQPPAHQAAPPDGQIQAQVTNNLESNPATMNARSVWLNNVSVNNGVVTLAGNVPNEDTKAACERVARTVAGVSAVTNNITVGSSRPNAPIQPIQPIQPVR